MRLGPFVAEPRPERHGWRTSEVTVPHTIRLRDIGWIVAFVALCAAWSYEVIIASRYAAAPKDTGVWICPILGRCGPAGTPGLGRW
jgi:hypothetical protein